MKLEPQVLHISVYYLRSCAPFCSSTQNVSGKGHCTSSWGSKCNQYVCSRRPYHPDLQYFTRSMKSLNNFRVSKPLSQKFDTRNWHWEAEPIRPWAGYRPPPRPRGNFVHYDILKLHYIEHKIKDVSFLRVAALRCNVTLYTLPHKSIKRPW